MDSVFLRPGRPLLIHPGLVLLQGTVSGAGGGSTISGGGVGGSVPGALTGLVAGVVTSTTVLLTWAAPFGATAITVNYRLHGASSWTTATASLSGTATSYTVPSLTAATAYDFQAFGTDSTGAGAAGEIDNVSTASAGLSVPGAITGLTLGTTAPTSLPLTWTLPTSGGAISAITVQYRLHGSGSYTVFSSTLPANSTAETITGLTASTAYDIQVFATNSAGSGSAATLSNVSTASSTLLPVANSNVLVIGQSNALFTFDTGTFGQDTDGSFANLTPTAQAGIGFFLQATTSTITWNGDTLIGQNGIYPNGSSTPYGSWLTNPNGSALYPAQLTSGTWIDPSQWTWGSPDGTNFETFIGTLTSQQLAGITAIWSYWGENDSERQYVEKPVWKAAYLRLLTLIRALIGKSAAQLPVLDWAGISSLGNDQGMFMTREARYELAADPANNINIILPQTGDSIPRGATYNSNGTWSGGDTWHQDDEDYRMWVTRAAQPVAQVILTAQGAGTLPAGLGSGLGPKISSVSMSANVVTVTVTHDIGTALETPLQAANGLGWVIMDGGTPGLPGNLITGISATVTGANTFQVAFLGIPANPLGACTLHYPYGNQRIGRGNCVTDNASTITRPSGWDAGAALSIPQFDQNMPLRMPMSVTGGGSSAVASCGMPLAAPVANLGAYGFNLQNINMPSASSYAPGAQIYSYLDDGSTQAVPYTAPATFYTGITSSLGALPSTYVQASRGSGGAATWYGGPNIAPSTPGQYYMVGEGRASDHVTVLSRITRGPFTVT